MKLKTLKDLRYFASASGMMILEETLKKEAIKWANDKENYREFDHKENYWLWVFMTFHNIKEEDLK